MQKKKTESSTTNHTTSNTNAKDGNQTIVNVMMPNGYQQPQMVGRTRVQRNWIVALVLSITLGWLGVDRFYVGHYGLGILKLITFGGYGIWWLIDIIMFATKQVQYVDWVQ